MADGSNKLVHKEVIKLWGLGPDAVSLFTDLTGPTKNADAVDLPSFVNATVNSSATAAVTDSSFNTNEQLAKNIEAFVNEGMTPTQYLQMLNGSYPEALMKMIIGSMKDNVNRALLHYLIARAGSSLDYQANIAADALTNDDIQDTIGIARDQPGASDGLWQWVMNPRFAAQVRKIAAFQPVVNEGSNRVGLAQIGFLGGIPAFEHAAMPGGALANRFSTTTSAATIASNVATITVPSGHGFLAGQQVWTSGLTANIAVTAPATITSVTATTIVVPLIAGDGAMADGVGTVYSASSMGMLVYQPWAFYAVDRLYPEPLTVKREGAAGWALQLYEKYGRYLHLGGAFVVHAPD